MSVLRGFPAAARCAVIVLAGCLWTSTGNAFLAVRHAQDVGARNERQLQQQQRDRHDLLERAQAEKARERARAAAASASAAKR